MHGDWQGRAYGDLDVELSAEGLRDTEERARAFGALPLERVVSSPLERALSLGRGVAERSGAPLAVEDDLRELDRGAWQGLRREEIEERHPEQIEAYYGDPWSYEGHGGESDARLCGRTWPVLEAAVQEGAGAPVLFATHYNVIRVLVARALGIEPSRSFGLRLDPGRGVLLVDSPTGWVLARSNVCGPDDGDAA